MTEKVATEILSLPMYPQLTRAEQETIVQAVKNLRRGWSEDAIPRATASDRGLSGLAAVRGMTEHIQLVPALDMTVYEIDPTRDERWDEFLQNHPDASIFHTRGWLEALRRTYGYQPVAFTTSPPGCPLTNGLPFCQISSWLSGRRLVSLPFSDHCAPLVESPEQLTSLLTHLQDKLDRGKWSYIETQAYGLRLPRAVRLLAKARVSAFHKLDLASQLGCRSFITSTRIACREKFSAPHERGLTYEEGRSDSLVTKFYHLLLMTRRRHGLPAQPIQWFRNIIACLGDKAKIRVASKDGRPVASIVTLRYKALLFTSMAAPIADSVIWAAHNCCSGMRSRKPSMISFPNLIWAAVIGKTRAGRVQGSLGCRPDNAGLPSISYAPSPQRFGSKR